MSLPAATAYWNFNSNLNNQISGSYNFTSSGVTYSDDRISDSSSKSATTNGSSTFAYTSSSPWTSWATTMTVAQWTKSSTRGLLFGCNSYYSNSSNDMVRIGNGAWDIVGFGGVSGQGLPSTWANGWNFTCIVFKGVWNRTDGGAMCTIYKYRTKASSYSSNIVSYIPHAPAPSNNITLGTWYQDWMGSSRYYGTTVIDSAYIFMGQLTDAQVYALYDFTAPKYNLQSYA
jgi:hypothetical protein